MNIIHPSQVKYFQPTSTYNQSRPWEPKPRALPPGDKLLLSGQAPLPEMPKSIPSVKAEAVQPEKSAKPAGSTWDRLLSYFFFPSSLDMNKVVELGKNLINSYGQDYGQLLTPADGQVKPEVAKAQRFAQSLADKVGGEALKQKGIEFKVNIYSSDRTDSFSRTDANAPRKNFFQKVASVFGGSEEKPEPIEIGLTVGALKNLKTEDELAFLVAREVAKTLDGDNEITVNNMLSSQGNQVAADAEAFQMMTKAGYDPALGLGALNELSKNEQPGNNSLGDAIDAAISTSHSQGVRMALGQLNVEYLRRSEAAAHPQSVHKAIPQELVEGLPSEKVVNPLTDAVKDLAKAYATQPLVVEYDGVLSPGYGTVRHELSQKPWNPQDAGDALVGGLEVLKDLPAQEKVTRGLALIQGLSAEGFHKGGPAEMGKEVTDFFASAKGWKAEEVLATLNRTAEESTLGNNPSADFAFQVLMNPKFQSAVAPLMKDDPEWQKLFQAVPQMLATSKDGSREAVQEQLSGAFGILAGQERGEDYPLYRRWPASLEPGAGELDGMLRDSFKSFMQGKVVKGHHNVKDYVQKFDGALQTDFVNDMKEVLAPSLNGVAAQRDQLLAKPQLNQEEVTVLFELLELAPVGEEKQAQLLGKLVSADKDIPYFQDQPFAKNETWANFLGDALASDRVSASDKEVVFKKMLETTPSQGVRGFDPGAKQLVGYMKEKSNLELLGLVELEIANNGIGSPLNEVGEAPRHGNPVLSLIGSDRELSTRVAADTHPLQFDAWLEKLHSGDSHRLDHGARRFLLDSMLNQQKKTTKLDEWSARVNRVMDNYTLELNPDLKPKMQEFLVPTLQKMEPQELRKALHGEPVMKVLNEEQATELLVDVLNPKALKGQDEKLRTTVVR